jgi:uncharacterized membrane protein YcaP (DUF421 family)
VPSIALKVAVVYVFLMVAFRLVGKRELGMLSPFELVTIILIPEMASEALMGTGSLTEALVGISVLLLLVLSISALTHRFARFAHIAEAAPTVLVAHGKFHESAMNRERIQPDELYGELHKHGFEDLSQIRWAILESDGQISFVPEASARSPLPADHDAKRMTF